MIKRNRNSRMFLPFASLQRAFRRIQKRALQTNNSIKVFVAPDCDGICAVKILTILLKSEFVPYVVQPVCGYEDLLKSIEQHLNENAETTSIILINCGNLMDLTEITEPHPNLMIYVIDSRRPYNMRNVDSEQIVLMDDGDASQNLPTEAYLIYQNYINSEDNEEERDDGENEGQGDEGDGDDESETDEKDDESEASFELTTKKKVDQSTTLDEQNSEKSGKDDSGDGHKEIAESTTDNGSKEVGVDVLGTDEGDDGSAKEGSAQDTTQLSSKKRKRASETADEWSDEGSVSDEGDDTGDGDNDSTQGDTESRPKKKATALESYLEERRNIKEKQRRFQKAKQILQDYYSSESYGTSSSVVMFHLSDQLSKKNNQLLWLGIVGLTDLYVHGKISREQYIAEAALFQARVQDLNLDNPSIIRTEEGTPIPVVEDKIVFREDYRLMLYRHWSLYDSLYHSTYVASRFGIWKEQGRLKLQTFLAAMGVPLNQCQQKYSCMKSDLQASLFEKFKTYAPKFGLEDILFGTFLMNVGFKVQLCASDVVYAISALLDCESQQTKQSTHVNEEDLWKNNFWAAFDSLSKERMDLLQNGLQQSIRIQRAVVEQGMLLLEKKAIVTSYAFRYAFLHDCRDLELFSHPLILSKLAHFLVDVHQQNKRASKALVLAALLKSKQAYLVIGVGCAPKIGSIVRNEFGQAFRTAAELTNAQVKHDSFDSSTILVSKDDLSKFLAALQTRVQSY